MKLILSIDAYPQERPRVHHGVATDPPKSRKFKEDIAMLAKAQNAESVLLTGELQVELNIYRAASRFKSGVTSKRYGDIDNLAKAILDGLTRVVWKDDKQISRLLVTKNLADTPRIEICIEERRSESAMAKG